MTYPKRPPFFAHRFVRLMGKVCLGAEVGPETCWLLTVVAHTEDARRYTGRVTFFNPDLAARCGLSVSAMRRARDRAVAAGWLSYEEGGKRRAGFYFVTVPEEYAGLNDSAGDEGEGDMLRHSDATTDTKAAENRHEPGRQAAANRPADAHPSTLLPSPLPDPVLAPGAAVAASETDGDDPYQPPPLTAFVTAWNAAGLPPVHPTAQRRGLWQVRWQDDGFRRLWRAAVARAGRSPRCRGELGGWRASATWFLKDPDAVVRVLEGEFDEDAGTLTPETILARRRAEETANVA